MQGRRRTRCTEVNEDEELTNFAILVSILVVVISIIIAKTFLDKLFAVLPNKRTRMREAAVQAKVVSSSVGCQTGNIDNPTLWMTRLGSCVHQRECTSLSASLLMKRMPCCVCEASFEHSAWIEIGGKCYHTEEECSATEGRVSKRAPCFRCLG